MTSRGTSGRTVLVTGAGRGLGLALARGALARGDTVVGTLREPARAPELVELQRQNDSLHIVPLDVADPASCAALPEHVARCVERVDVLFNNAGINSLSHDVLDRRTAFDLEALDPGTLEQMMRTNALGPILVTRALLPLLMQKAQGAQGAGRVVNISSRRGALHDKTTGGNYGYCMSKAALNMATRALGADALPFGVVVVAVHPGAVRTTMAQPDATLSADEAAAKLLALADALGPAHAGLFLRNDGTEHPW